MNIISFNHHKYQKFKVVNTIPIVQMSVSRFRKIKGRSQGPLHYIATTHHCCTASSLFLQTRLFEPHRIQQWVAISSSRGSSRSTDWTRLLSLLHWQAGSLSPGKPLRKPRPHATQNKNQACYRHILGFLGDTSGKEPVCLFRRLKRCSFDPWVRKIPGGGNGNLFQYSCLENPMDRGAWKAAVHHVSKSQTWLRDWANTRRHWTCQVRL